MTTALLAGCGLGGPVEPVHETGGTSTSMTPTTGAAASGGARSTSTESPSTSDGSTFIQDKDGGCLCECDNWQQDCPAGQKCAAYSADDDNWWDSLQCVPVMDEPAAPGEPCFVVGDRTSGIDNCERGAMCWNTDGNNQGTCVALCAGSPADPSCPPGTQCELADDVLNLCVDLCDPLVQDCPLDLVCKPVEEGFICILPVQGVDLHDSCYDSRDCDPDAVCVESSSAVECDPRQPMCCEALCDLTLPNPCTGQGQVCTPWYVPPNVPVGYENLGYCSVPM